MKQPNLLEQIMHQTARNWLRQCFGDALPNDALDLISGGIGELLYPFVRITATVDLADKIGELAEESPGGTATALRETAVILDQAAHDYLTELIRGVPHG
jgi:hypothetical protein